MSRDHETRQPAGSGSSAAPKPHGPKDATSASPPSAESAVHDELQSRTHGLGEAVPDLDHTPVAEED
jgi:hypothetical protein